ncbi:DUF6157 family protein [Catalinimonas niigatensis]|uniref:DUF6157 family protein n=1 Tax=Catalinimonas niigatensis TaxID=1397264 RepID=UPI002665A72D|nr:DUF6157 family protein [Catalinimonas niigatensis]WPP50468.1 DUF6157 family protein [Catalinimonas niigatensis]
MKSTNYYDTFIEVAEDCPVLFAEVPPQRGDEKSVANLLFEMVSRNPYRHTSDEVIFAVFAAKKDFTEEELEEEKAKFFSKGQACLRASPLTKRYGWGVHSNAEGKVALYALDSEEYKKLSEDQTLKHLKAMRSKRA